MPGAFSLLHPKLRDVLPSLGYEEPLPVQDKAIPVILAGSNALIVAPTGSGKTEAAVLPLLSRMLDEGGSGGPRLVYVTPLRALNRDVVARIDRLAGAAGLRVMVRHGDSGPRARRDFISRPPDLVVTTPESLGFLVTSLGPRGFWSNTKYIIVDEVHELLESERGSELSLVIARLQRFAGRRLQKIGLSATLSRRSVEEAARLIAGPERVSIVEDRTTKRYSVSVDIAADRWEEDSWKALAGRVAELARGVKGSVLVFTNTRTTAEMLGLQLSKLLGEELVRVHHGSLARNVREEAERLFREGRVKVLVATSSMELGIDVGSVDLVIQILSPRQVIAMTQRAGRAGHSLFETSKAVIVTFNNVFESLESGVIALRTERGHLEDVRAHRKPLDAMAHQLAGMVIEGTAPTLDKAYSIFAGTYPFQDLDYSLLEDVASHLSSVRVLKVEGGGRLRQGRRARKYYFNVSMIPDEVTYTVVNFVDDSKVGELSSRFVEAVVAARIQGGGDERPRFALAGRVWELLDVNVDEGRIYAKPVYEAESHLPVWEGELIPVHYKVAREVCSLLSLAMYDPPAAEGLLRGRKLPDVAVHRILDVARETVEAWGGPHLGPYRPVIEAVPDGNAILYACLGSKGNMALGMLLSNMASKRLSTDVHFDYIPYAIVFNAPVAGERLAKALAEALAEAAGMDRATRAVAVYSLVRESKAFLIRFMHVAKRMGVVDPEAVLSVDQARKLVESYRDTLLEREAVREVIHDKIDINALNDFLDNMRDLVVLTLSRPSRLALEVLDNPYLKRDRAVNLKTIALDLLIRDKKRSLSRKRVILACTRCGRAWTTEVSRINRPADVRCPSCKGLAVAPFPDTPWGRRAAEAVAKSFRANGSLSKEERALLKEAMERAMLMINYASMGRARHVVEALMTRGVGPGTAKRALNALVGGGERSFYEELIKAEENYIVNSKYWDKGRRAR